MNRESQLFPEVQTNIKVEAGESIPVYRNMDDAVIEVGKFVYITPPRYLVDAHGEGALRDLYEDVVDGLGESQTTGQKLTVVQERVDESFRKQTMDGDRRIDAFLREKYTGGPAPLNEYIEAGVGACVPTSLAVAGILARLIKEGRIPGGEVKIIRRQLHLPDNDSSHVFVEYMTGVGVEGKAINQHTFVIDTVWRWAGEAKDYKKDIWPLVQRALTWLK